MAGAGSSASKRRGWLSLLLLLLIAVAMACGGGDGREPEQRLGSTSSAVAGGTLDTTDLFPYVVKFTGPEGGFCSGILITPNWIATANHCITGKG